MEIENKPPERKVIAMTAPLFLCYPKCTTCKKAQKWLDDNHIEITVRDIAKENPTEDELRAWHKASGLPLKKFFNTSGKKYKEQHLKDKLPEMSEDEQFRLLATDGLLVKRPIFVGSGFVLVGFKEADWEKRLTGAEAAEPPELTTQETKPQKAAKKTKTPKKSAPEPEQPKVSVRAFRMKVTLRGMKPEVWRRFFVPEDMTFSEFAEVLIRVMGWTGRHMAAFELPKSGMNIIAASWTDEMQLGERDGRKVKLTQYLPDEKKFIFVYDMGDNWEHEIVVEDIRENYPALHAAVLAYEGDCPPEDCGGVWSFMEKLAKTDAETEKWLAESSHPYNMEGTNVALREIKAGNQK